MDIVKIAGVEITTDNEGRFNLNLLHKAANLGKSKAPAQWLRTQQAKELVSEVEKETVQICIVSVEGRNGGTFAHELIAVEYAGWISAAFRIKVNQTFIDYRSGKFQHPVIPQTRLEMLKLAVELEEKNEALKIENNTLKPKADALDRIATADGSICITDAAKNLQVRPKDLFNWLNAHEWIYKRAGNSHWVAYQEKIKQGLLEHKTTLVTRSDGSEKTTEQVRVMPKGLSKLALELEKKAA